MINAMQQYRWYCVNSDFIRLTSIQSFPSSCLITAQWFSFRIFHLSFLLLPIWDDLFNFYIVKWSILLIFNFDNMIVPRAPQSSEEKKNVKQLCALSTNMIVSIFICQLFFVSTLLTSLYARYVILYNPQARV